jgi:paraquat-inducible protein A
MEIMAVLVFCSTILFPLCELLALLYVLLPLRAGYVPPGLNAVLRGIQLMRPWGMIEVFMLGVLVTLVKMVSIARVIPEAALFAFGVLTLMLAVVVSFDPRALWDLAGRLGPRQSKRLTTDARQKS